MFRTWKSVLAAAANETFAESVVDGQNIKTTFDFSLMHLKRRSVGVGREGNAPRSEQNRPQEAGVETCQLGIRGRFRAAGDTGATDARRQPALHLPRRQTR